MSVFLINSCLSVQITNDTSMLCSFALSWHLSLLGIIQCFYASMHFPFCKTYFHVDPFLGCFYSTIYLFLLILLSHTLISISCSLLPVFVACMCCRLTCGTIDFKPVTRNCQYPGMFRESSSGSLNRAVNDPNHWAISPVLHFLYW